MEKGPSPAMMEAARKKPRLTPEQRQVLIDHLADALVEDLKRYPQNPQKGSVEVRFGSSEDIEDTTEGPNLAVKRKVRKRKPARNP